MRDLWMLVPLLAITAVVWASTAPREPNPTIAAGDEMRIDFARPIDWRCRHDGGCVVCANVGAAESDIVVVEAGEGGRHTHHVPSGSMLRVCPS